MTSNLDFDITVAPTQGEPEKTVIPSDRTQTLEPVTCPVCSADNPPSEQWCADCGFLLGSEPGAQVEAPTEGPRLVDESTGREYWLSDGESGIGRDGPEVVLADPSVSRRHAKITNDENGYRIEDLGSSNGTKVDGAPLPAGESRQLKGGELLVFGSVSVRLMITGVETPAADAEPEEEAATEPMETIAWLIGADGTEYAIPAASVTLGRRPSNKIVLANDLYISGMHGQLLYQDGSFSFLDLGSTNGSFVNEQQVTPDQPVPLADGDKLTLGRTELIFKVGDPYAVNAE